METKTYVKLLHTVRKQTARCTNPSEPRALSLMCSAEKKKNNLIQEKNIQYL